MIFQKPYSCLSFLLMHMIAAQIPITREIEPMMMAARAPPLIPSLSSSSSVGSEDGV
jgi:hypothetical protein